MTRASAANADGCPAGSIPAWSARGADASGFGWLWPPRLRQHVAFAPLALAAAFVLAILAVVAVTAEQLGLERDLALNEAAREVDVRATLLAARLDAAFSAAPQASPGEVLRSVLKAHPDERLARAVLIDRAGQKAAIDPPDAPRRLLSDLIAAGEPATPGSGVVRIASDSDGEQFATVRPLAATGGRVAFASPVAHHLAAWSRAAHMVGALLAATIALVLAAAALYGAERRAKQKRAVDEKTMRARMELALNRGRCGLWTWDLQQDRISWSASMFGMLDLAERPAHWSRSELQALMHPEDGDLAEIARSAFARRGQCVDVEFRLRAGDGRWVWLRKRAELVIDETTGAPSLVGVAFEVTGAKERALEAAAAERRLREAIDAMSDAFVLWDPDRRLVLSNSKYQSLHNLLGDLSPSAGVEPSRSYEMQLADGRWLHISERRMRDGFSVAVAADITAIKARDDELIRSKRRLTAAASQLRLSRRLLEEQSQELAELAERYREQKTKAEAASRAKAEFLANMSHELRTPLNAIIGFSQLMEDQAFGALGCERYRDYCAHILASGRHLLRVFSDILDMSRLEAGRERLTFACVSAEQAMRRALHDVAAIAREKGVALRLDIGADLALEADSAALERIFTILMRNAVKFAPDGGSVEIGAEAAGGHVHFYVQDNGPGVTAEDVARLCRPFEQGRVVMANGMKGAGLGLAIAKSLAELHGGTLRLDSRPGEGAVAVVALPRKQRSTRSIVAQAA